MNSINKFNVIIENNGKFEPYDIIPHLIDEYNCLVDIHKEMSEYPYKVPETFNEFKEFVKRESAYQWWGRCEYEIILSDWPSKRNEEKWDIHRQVMMNIDIVTNILMDNVIH